MTRPVDRSPMGCDHFTLGLVGAYFAVLFVILLWSLKE